MLNSLIYSLNATVPVFAIILIGKFLKNIKLIDLNFANISDKFVYYVCLPCLVFYDLSKTDIRHNFHPKFLLFCFVTTFLSILIIWGLAKIFLKDKTIVGSFVQGSYRSSAAILGTVFILNIYGTTGMAPLMIIGAVPLYNIFAVIILTLESKSVKKGKTEISPKKLARRTILGILKNPIIIGIALGLLASFVNLPQATMFRKTVSYFANLTAPLALISIGASFEIKKALNKVKPALAATFIKLIGLAAIALPIAVKLGFRDEYLIAIVIMLASPSTPSCYVMAKEMDNDAVLSSSIIVLTTCISAITLTFWIFLMKAQGLIV